MTPVVLAVTGLAKEARIAAGPGILPLAGGGLRTGLERRLAAVDPSALRAVVSFGIAGALEPGLRLGDVVLATAIVDGNRRYPASPEFRKLWAERLGGEAIAVAECAIAGVDEPVLAPDAKAALRARSGAGAVDMESHLAADFAARHGLPFGAVRVVSDRADRVLPPAAGIAMRPDGSVDVLGVMRSVARDPGQIPALAATARDAAVAFRALRRVRGLLGDLLGLEL
ncbi:phosphorylase [Enterovirga aerilata]|uniref:Phosphorylase n=1 Tax=Enterovirga aerilata TaxID=2730920 RepID=A0A849HWB2_9HYPH|nr:phosphorylase [Enterovirga sp. DB1703]NNM71826.1 phosphorylase [Enterovirga sp. DB1703]